MQTTLQAPKIAQPNILPRFTQFKKALRRLFIINESVQATCHNSNSWMANGVTFGSENECRAWVEDRHNQPGNEKALAELAMMRH